MSLGTSTDEYQSLCENMRWYSNIRFAQLTLFVTLTAALLAVVFAASSPLSRTTAFLKIVGALSVFFFWIMEERAAEYWRHFQRRAIDLERELGYKQFSTVPAHRANTTHLFRGFFLVVFLFWALSFFVG